MLTDENTDNATTNTQPSADDVNFGQAFDPNVIDSRAKESRTQLRQADDASYRQNATWGQSLALAPGAVMKGGEGMMLSLAKLGSDISGAMGGPELDPDLTAEADYNLRTRTGVEDLTKNVSQFAVGMLAADPAVGAVGDAAGIGAYTKTLHTAAGMLTDGVAFDGQQQRLSNLINDHFPSLANPVTEYLAANPDDNWADARLKNAIEGAGVGYVSNLLFRMIGMGKAAAVGDKSDYSAKLAAAQDELKTIAKADELRSQIHAAAPNISDDQITQGLTLHILVGKETGKTADQALDQIAKVVPHDGSDVEDALGQKAGDTYYSSGAAAADQQIRDYQNEQQLQPDSRGGVGVTNAKTYRFKPVESNPVAIASDDRIPLSDVSTRGAIPVEQNPKATVNPNALPLDDGSTPTESPINPNATVATGLRQPTEPIGGIPLKSDARIPDSNPIPLASATDPVTKGYTKFISDTQAIIGLHDSADVSTFLHESFHLFRRFGLSDDLQSSLKSALGVSADAPWTRDLEETAARQFERWWTDGNAPNKALQPMFQSARQWMLAVYHAVDSSDIAAPVSPQVRNVFANMIGAAPEDTAALTNAAAKSAATAQATAMDNDPALYLAQKQGQPIKPDLLDQIKNTVTQQLNDSQTWNDVERGVFANVNMTRINGDTDTKSIIQQVQDALASSVKDSVGTLTNDQLSDAAKTIAADWNTTPAKALAALKDEAVQNAGLPMRVLAGRMVRNQFAQELVQAAKLAEQSPGNATLASLADEKWAAYANAAKYAKESQIAVGRALNGFNIPTDGIDTAFESSIAKVQKMLDASPNGSLARRLFYKQLVAAGDAGTIDSLVNSLGNAYDRFGSKALSLHDELWRNGLLSGPRTLLTNALSQTMMTGLMPLNRVVGGTITGNLNAVWRGFKLYTNLVASALDIFHVADLGMNTEESSLGRAAQVLMTEQPVLDSLTTVDGGPRVAWSADNLGIKDGTGLASAVNTLGKVIRLPFRLLTTMDEWSKQINYRAYLRDELLDEAQRQGISNPDDLAVFIRDGLAEGFDANGRATYSPALDYARQATFTQPLGKFGQWLQDGANQFPLLGNVIPFIRTPINILKTFRDYTPGLNLLSGEFRSQLTNPDPIIRSEAAGKLALGAMFWGSAYAFAASGRITGNGPSDPKLKQQLLDSGWQPLSFVTNNPDGTKTYTSFKRMEPLAMILGLVADYHDAAQWMDQDTKNATATAMLMPVAKNIVNKTYLKGLSDVLEALSSPDGSIEKLVQQRAASEVPFSGLLGNLNDDPDIRDARTFMDGVLKTVPGYGDGLPPKRNLFGEPITNPYGISPFTQTTSTSNPVQQELTNLRYGFSGPSREYRGIDLSMVKNPTGQDAFDRLQELHGQVKVGGKTMADALGQLIGSNRYQQFPQPQYAGDMNNPRVQAVQATISRYRDAATRQMLREYPQVEQQYRQIHQQILQQRLTPTLAKLAQSQQVQQQQ